MRDAPDLSFETIKRMEDMTWFTHAQIFDDLLIVSQRETSCYILKTSEGLVVIDGICAYSATQRPLLRSKTAAMRSLSAVGRFL